MKSHRGRGSLERMITFKDYLERLAARPATLPNRERRARISCARCDGELFVLYPDRDAICAGCGATLKPESTRSKQIGL